MFKGLCHVTIIPTPANNQEVAEMCAASTLEPLAAGHRRMPRIPDGLVGGSQVEIVSPHTIAPPQGIAELRREDNRLAHRSVVSTPLVGRIEHTRDRWRVITSDGIVDLAEQEEMRRELALMEPEAQLVQRSLRFVSIAIQGAGVDGSWFDRNWREYARDQSRLRLVVDNTDGPEPGGPGAAQPAKRKPRDEGNRQAA